MPGFEVFYMLLYMFPTLRRLFARRISKPTASPSLQAAPQDPELMAIVQKHVDTLLAQGLGAETIIKRSFGEEVMQKLPTDPGKAAQKDVKLSDLNLNLDPKLLAQLQALSAKRAKEAKSDTEARLSVPAATAELPSAYKQSDIDKVTPT